VVGGIPVAHEFAACDKWEGSSLKPQDVVINHRLDIVFELFGDDGYWGFAAGQARRNATARVSDGMTGKGDVGFIQHLCTRQETTQPVSSSNRSASMWERVPLLAFVAGVELCEWADVAGIPHNRRRLGGRGERAWRRHRG